MLLAACLLPFGAACFFDADLPLQNDSPSCTNRSEIKATLLYPESSVCTLSISDRNDSMVSLSAVPGNAMTGDGLSYDSLSIPWPGRYEFLSTGYGVKLLHLLLDTNRMGRYNGILLLQDAASATLRIPYDIEKKFIDPFDTSPLSDDVWESYVTDDSLHLGFDYIDGKLAFTFRRSDDTLHAPLSTGIRSRFSLPSSFFATVDFKLRDEMDEAFEVGFFISSSSDTGRWAGGQAGIFISGVNGRLRFECRSINLQSYSYETSVVAGELGMARTDSTITYYLHDGNPAVVPLPLTFQTYPAEVPVYMHLKMIVRDLSKDRNCYWNDFTVPEGLISFAAQ